MTLIQNNFFVFTSHVILPSCYTQVVGHEICHTELGGPLIPHSALCPTLYFLNINHPFSLMNLPDKMVNKIFLIFPQKYSFPFPTLFETFSSFLKPFITTLPPHSLYVMLLEKPRTYPHNTYKYISILNYILTSLFMYQKLKVPPQDQD